MNPIKLIIIVSILALPIKALGGECLPHTPDTEESFFNRALCHQQNQNYSEAIADYSKILLTNRDNKNARYNRGLIYAKYFRNYTLALADFEYLHAISPYDADILFQIANIHNLTERTQEALTAYSRAIELDSDLGEAYFNRALIYHRVGWNEESLRDLEKAKELFRNQGNIEGFNRVQNALNDLINP